MMLDGELLSPAAVRQMLMCFPPERVLGSLPEVSAMELIESELVGSGLKPKRIEFPYFQHSAGELLLPESDGWCECEIGAYAGMGAIRNEIFNRVAVWDERRGAICEPPDNEGGATIVLSRKHWDAEIADAFRKGGYNTFAYVIQPGRNPALYRAFSSDDKANDEFRGIVVGYEQGCRMLELPPGATLKISMGGEINPAAGSCLVINEDALLNHEGGIVLSAHVDCVDGSPGCSDNAVGCAILVQLCKQLAMTDEGRQICFVWTTAEEVGLLGMRAMQQRWLRLNAKIHMAMILDVLGGALSSDEIVLINGDILDERSDSVWKEFEHQENIERRESVRSDGAPLAEMDVPVVMLHRPTGFMHNAMDAPWTITHVGLKRSINLVCRTLKAALGRPPA